jgi:hypothetical protein
VFNNCLNNVIQIDNGTVVSVDSNVVTTQIHIVDYLSPTSPAYNTLLGKCSNKLIKLTRAQPQTLFDNIANQIECSARSVVSNTKKFFKEQRIS